MKGGLSIGCADTTALATSLNPVAQAYQVECERAKRRKAVQQLASHLAMVFCISPDQHALVYTLCGGGVKNNFEALKSWVDAKLTDENAEEQVSFWESELSRVLSQAKRAF
ncbi:MAG: hypothetical protein ACI8WB_005251 [Phenylobacterium sp.]|jgi:hypothetical protein